jgi:hypothetical protein
MYIKSMGERVWMETFGLFFVFVFVFFFLLFVVVSFYW